MVTLYPFEYDGLLLLGWTKLKLDKKAEAETLFEKVLLNMPTDKSAIEGLTYIKGAPSNSKVYQAFVKSYEALNKPDYKSAISILKEVYDKKLIRIKCTFSLVKLYRRL